MIIVRARFIYWSIICNIPKENTEFYNYYLHVWPAMHQWLLTNVHGNVYYGALVGHKYHFSKNKISNMPSVIYFELKEDVALFKMFWPEIIKYIIPET